MKHSITLILLSALFLAGSTSAETIDAAGIWTANCKKCHAEDGTGSTKIGQKFGVRDYTDAAVQASFTDEEIVRVTQEGVIDGGKKKMPPYAEKLSDEEIQALVPIIRSFSQ